MSACNKDSACRHYGEELPEDYIPRIEEMLMVNMNAIPKLIAFEKKDSSDIAQLIWDSMTTEGRVYHSMQHVFDISKTMKDPILVLSALFHDVVYTSIDESFSPRQAELLEGIVEDKDGVLRLAETFDDEGMCKLVELYGFTFGAEFPKSGTNEFLSGAIAMRVLQQWLDLPQLMEVASCIEATIPFRPIVDEKTPMDRLYDRLKKVMPCQSEEWLEKTIGKAAITANCDLCSFDDECIDFFIDSSWKLIPEWRSTMLDDDVPLMEWLQELNDLEGRTKFLISVVPNIFQSFRNSPSKEVMTKKQEQAYSHLDLVMAYGNVRQLQVMLLVDMVEYIGENAAALPLKPFQTLEVPTSVQSSDEALTSQEKEVRRLLIHGRRTGFSWDPAISSLGGYLFNALGSKGVSEAVSVYKASQRGSHDLLQFLPEEVLRVVSAKLSTVFTEKADSFRSIPEKLGVMAQ